MKNLISISLFVIIFTSNSFAQWKFITKPDVPSPSPNATPWSLDFTRFLSKDTSIIRLTCISDGNLHIVYGYSIDGGNSFLLSNVFNVGSYLATYSSKLMGTILNFRGFNGIITSFKGVSTNGGISWDTITSSNIFSDLKIQSDFRRQIDKLHFDSVFYTDEGSPGSNDNKILYKTTNLGISKQVVIDSLLDRTGGLKYFNLNKDTLWVLRRMPDNLSMAPNESFRSNYGRLFRSINGGQSWTFIPNNIDTSTGIFRPGNLYFASIDTGYMGVVKSIFNNESFLYKTTDGGKNWYQINKANYLAKFSELYFVNSKIGFAYGGNSAVLKTTDGGLTWFEQTTIPPGEYKEMGMTKDGTIYVKLQLSGGYYFTTTKGDNPSVGIHESKHDIALQTFTIYPNPTDNKDVSVSWLSESMDKATIHVFDLFGRLVYTTSVNPDAVGKFIYPISLNSSSGLYVIRVEQNGKSSAKSVIVK